MSLKPAFFYREAHFLLKTLLFTLTVYFSVLAGRDAGMAAKNGTEIGHAVETGELGNVVDAFAITGQHALGGFDTQFGDVVHYGGVLRGAKDAVKVKSRNIEMIGQHFHGKRQMQIMVNVVNQFAAQYFVFSFATRRGVMKFRRGFEPAAMADLRAGMAQLVVHAQKGCQEKSLGTGRVDVLTYGIVVKGP